MSVTPSGRIVYRDPSYRTLAVMRPPEPARRIALGFSLLLADVPGEEEESFDGCLVRITELGIWSPTIERVGYRWLEVLAPGDDALRGTPSVLFASGELVDAQALLALPMLFDWDAYLVPASGRLLLFISHDGLVEIVAKTQAIFEATFEQLESGGWNIRERVSRERY